MVRAAGGALRTVRGGHGRRTSAWRCDNVSHEEAKGGWHGGNRSFSTEKQPFARLPNESIALWLERLVDMNAPDSIRNNVQALFVRNQVPDLTTYLWEERERTSHLFPLFGLGQHVLHRDRLVKMVKAQIAEQRRKYEDVAGSIYVSGCPGSGKSSFLQILAKSLKADDYEVYFFESSGSIPAGAELAFRTLLQDRTKKVAVLIDGMGNLPNDALIVELLRGNHPNLVTIGAAVPRYSSSSVYFTDKLRTADLALKAEDEDFQQLVKRCKDTKATTPELTEAICMDILEHCGGHAFPTLAIIEHLFFVSAGAARALLPCDVNKAEILSSRENFRSFFHGTKFASSDLYETVRSRCFHELEEREAMVVAKRVLTAYDYEDDTKTVQRRGWWDADAGGFISPLCLAAISHAEDAAKDK